MALSPVAWTPEWFNELETETETVINAAAALRYTGTPLTYYKTWTTVDPVYATAAMDAIKNWNRVKANVQAALDLFGLDDPVPAQFTPTAVMPGERITRAGLQQLVDALAAVDLAIDTIQDGWTIRGPWAGEQYAGGGPTL